MKNGTDKTLMLGTCNYKCPKCKDTTWVITLNGARRCECYEMDYIKRLWENYGIKAEEVKKLNDFKTFDSLTTNLKNKAYKYITQFNEIYTSRENSFGILGQSGSGKSHVSIAIGAALLNKNYKVVYMPYLEVMRELKANSMDDEYYNKLINRYKKAEVLVIDDLFKDKVKSGRLTGELTEADMKHIYPILNFRYANRLATIFSTECTLSQIVELDEALTGRMVEMCGENCIEIIGKEYNYRLKKLLLKEVN
ncbi:ATP-binding protein [uncultured Clostridium sp.]|uniref:ATP-binding protein n=1 Tax=uncultured Clostridium sp. TaxID=59620 RepID=UPI00267296D1|nr:ATP-binding protein [uncultured Clostridium sp.]